MRSANRSLQSKATKQHSKTSATNTPLETTTQTAAAPDKLRLAVEDSGKSGLTPDVLRTLQRTHGNRFVQRFIAGKSGSASGKRTPAIIHRQGATTSIQRFLKWNPNKVKRKITEQPSSESNQPDESLNAPYDLILQQLQAYNDLTDQAGDTSKEYATILNVLAALNGACKDYLVLDKTSLRAGVIKELEKDVDEEMVKFGQKLGQLQQNEAKLGEYEKNLKQMITAIKDLGDTELDEPVGEFLIEFKAFLNFVPSTFRDEYHSMNQDLNRVASLLLELAAFIQNVLGPLLKTTLAGRKSEVLGLLKVLTPIYKDVLNYIEIHKETVKFPMWSREIFTDWLAKRAISDDPFQQRGLLAAANNQTVTIETRVANFYDNVTSDQRHDSVKQKEIADRAIGYIRNTKRVTIPGGYLDKLGGQLSITYLSESEFTQMHIENAIRQNPELAGENEALFIRSEMLKIDQVRGFTNEEGVFLRKGDTSATTPIHEMIHALVLPENQFRAALGHSLNEAVTEEIAVLISQENALQNDQAYEPERAFLKQVMSDAGLDLNQMIQAYFNVGLDAVVVKIGEAGIAALKENSLETARKKWNVLHTEAV